jgi:hypothetical protein
MTLLNQADKIYIGSNLVSAVYAGSTKVWPAFKPTNLSGCAIWLDASQLGSLANGAAVNYFTNLVSGGQQPYGIGSPAPTFRTNALNTIMPVVRTTGGQGRFQLASTGIDKDWTLIYIGRRWSLKPGRVIAANASIGAGPNILVGYHGYEMDMCYIEGWLTSSTIPTSTTQWKMYSADSTSTSPARFFINGVLNSTGAATPAKGWGGTLIMGGYDDARSQDTDCEFAELVMYNRKLSDAERQQVENYLRAKWNPISPFAPLDLGSNLVAWFDAADVTKVITAGSGVYRWYTKGSGGMMFGQDTDANRPTYANQTVTSISPQFFNVSLGPASYDVIWVGRPNGPADWRTMFRNDTLGQHQVIIESGSTRIGTYNAGFYPAGGLTWDNVWGIGYGRFGDGAVSSLSRDGGPMTSTGTVMPAGSCALSTVGGYSGGSQAWGDIKEMIFLPYNSEGLRQIVEGYLANKYGLTGLLPSDHPYKNTSP